MSWLFGSKKKTVVQHSNEFVSTETNDGFIAIEPIVNRPYESAVPPYPVAPTASFPAYNILPQPGVYSVRPTPESRPPLEREKSIQVNFLDSIPFKLSPLISRASTTKSDIALLKDKIEQFKSRLSMYEYDFNTEKSFLQEVNS